ncbi:uncharacterized protein LOC120423013 [Culex pipiens pallens]|uniref:uncharacterized protein LOC120423013 n=1 Tax=Culex pipiens pallens TaxID=42434 RepID=UPI001954C46A|nr:uncharacterized protein LOC120423013 [Culex pipiens pallens]
MNQSNPKHQAVESSGSDEPRRVRKTVEVTSTRYTEIVEPSDGAQPPNGPMVVKRESPSPDLFTASFARVDNGIGEFHDTVGRDQRKFREQCLEMVQPYVARMEQVLGEVRRTDANEQFAKLEEDRLTDKDAIRDGLSKVLEASRERQQRRERELEEVLKHF